MSNLWRFWGMVRDQRTLFQKLLQKGSWALAEQAFFSGSTFVINTLLIRWLSATAYGAYTLAFAILIFVSGFYQALIFEPIAIHGSVKYRANFPYYGRIQALLYAQMAFGISILLALGVAIAMLLHATHDLVLGLAGITIGQGALLGLWLVRRLYYARHQVTTITFLTASYAFCQVLVLFALHDLGVLTPFSAFVGPAVSTAIIVLIGLLLLGKPNTSSSTERLSRQIVQIENWRYGNWLVLAAVTNWLSNYAYFVLVGAVLSIEETGALRAVQNLTLPAIQFLTVTGMLFFPWASEQFAAGGFERLQKVTMLYTVLMAVVASGYYILLLIFDQSLLRLLYAGSYGEYVGLIPWLGLVPILIGITAPLSSALRIGYSTLYSFILDLSSTVAVFTVSLYLTFSGLQGTVIGMIISNSIRIVVVFWLWHYLAKRKRLIHLPISTSAS